MRLEGNRFWLLLFGVLFLGIIVLMMVGPCQAVPAEGRGAHPEPPIYEPPVDPIIKPGDLKDYIEHGPVGSSSFGGPDDGTGDGGNVSAPRASGITIRGIVQAADDLEPIVGVDVLITGPAGRRGTVTGADGTFETDAPTGAPGSLTVIVMRPPAGFKSAAANVEVQSGQTVVDVVISLERSATLICEAYDSLRDRLPGAQIHWAIIQFDPRIDQGSTADLSQPHVRTGSATTDENGEARFDNLYFGLFRVTLTMRGVGRAVQIAVGFVRIDAPQEYRVELRLPSLYELNVRLLNPLSQPMVGIRARVAALTRPTPYGPYPQPSGLTDDRGEFIISELVEGRYTFQVAIDGYPEAEFTVAIPSTQATTVRFEQGATLAIRPIDADTGEAVTPQYVAVSRPGQRAQRRVARRGASEDKTVYLIEGLPAGNVVVTVSARGYRLAREELWVYADDREEVTVLLDPQGPGQRLEVRVTTPDDEPVEGALVQAVPQRGAEEQGDSAMALQSDNMAGGSGASGGAARTDANGIAYIEGIRPGTYFIRANKSGEGQGTIYDVHVEEGRPTPPQVVVIGGGSTVTIRLEDTRTGGSFDGAEVVLRRDTDSLLLRALRSTAGAGVYERKGVPEGDYTIFATPMSATVSINAPSLGSISVSGDGPVSKTISITSTIVSGRAMIGSQPVNEGAMQWHLVATGSMSETSGPYTRYPIDQPLVPGGSFVVGPIVVGRYVVDMLSRGRWYRAIITVPASGDIGNMQFSPLAEGVSPERDTIRAQVH